MSLADDLKTELKGRIKTDMEPLEKWNEKLCLKITFADYYGKSAGQLVTIHRMVGECVDNVIQPSWQMTADSWKGLQDAIDGTDTGETALPDMEEAAAVVEPRTDGGVFMLAVGKVVKLSSPKKKTPKKPSKSPKKPKTGRHEKSDRGR